MEHEAGGGGEGTLLSKAAIYVYWLVFLQENRILLKSVGRVFHEAAPGGVGKAEGAHQEC